MAETFQLFGYGIFHFGMTMTSIDHCNTSTKINIATAVDIPEFGIFGTLDIDVVSVALTLGKGSQLALLKLLVFILLIPG